MTDAEERVIVAPTVEWLCAEGFTRARDEVWAESFGDRLIELVRADVRVRFTRDRGLWFLTVAGRASNDYFDLAIWRACLESLDVPAWDDELGGVANETQIEYLRNVLGRIVSALNAEGATEECLRQTRHERARKRLPGLFP
jgi:hypothetical protein